MYRRVTFQSGGTLGYGSTMWAKNRHSGDILYDLDPASPSARCSGGSPPPLQHQQQKGSSRTAKLASHCWTAGLDGFLIYWDFATAELVRKTFTELKTATRNFRPDNELGEGGFGSVFKG
ncbi:Protein kinase APK1B, chloroplastic [Hordeum vulgare]|nr:Protein kinase APK1B, chloroplastic [Hordeum vulgare]